MAITIIESIKLHLPTKSETAFLLTQLKFAMCSLREAHCTTLPVIQ